MSAPLEDLTPLTEDIKAILSRTDIAGQGAVLGHALAWWLAIYAGPSPGARQRALELTGAMAMKLADLYEPAVDAVPGALATAPAFEEAS
jgi:hypothetical protein